MASCSAIGILDINVISLSDSMSQADNYLQSAAGPLSLHSISDLLYL